MAPIYIKSSYHPSHIFTAYLTFGTHLLFSTELQFDSLGQGVENKVRHLSNCVYRNNL